ncbi:MAG: segregation/condensation protein A, partial [Chloroflexota bacterium]|nr:segregation/condensation protein A [Chloroflexota bacterium]
MIFATENSMTLDGYQTRLPTFEGPLDLLLRLIERSQLAITDVSLVAVTDQFLDYRDRLGGAPAHVVAEFASVGARLVLIKSRGLLPKPPVTELDAEPDALVNQLETYRALKRAATYLADVDAIGRGGFSPHGLGVRSREVASPSLANYSASVLRQSLRRRMNVVMRPSL